MGEENNIELTLDRDIHIIDPYNDYQIKKTYEAGHFCWPEDVAKAWLNIEGVRLSSTDNTYQKPKLGFRSLDTYTHEEIGARQLIVDAIATKNLPYWLAKIAFRKTCLRLELHFDSALRSEYTEYMVQASVSAVCDTDSEYWDDKENNLDTLYDKRVSEIFYPNMREINLRNEKKISSYSIFENEKFLESVKYFETWNPAEGIALVCSIEPTELGLFSLSHLSATLPNTSSMNLPYSKRLEHSYYTVDPYEFSKLYLYLNKEHLLSENPNAIEAREHTLSSSLNNMARLLKFWNKKPEPEECLYSPVEFIDWALSMDHKIEWLDGAIERGLVNPDQLKNYKKKDIDASAQFAEFGRKAHEYKKPIRDEFQTKIEKITIPLIKKGRNDTDITRDIYRYYKQPVGNKGEENSLQFELSSGEMIEYGFHTIRKMIPNFRK